MSEKLIKELEEKAHDHCRQFTDISRRPSRFIQMLHNEGALLSIKAILAKDQLSDGFKDLWALPEPRLDLTMEALILENPQFHNLFTPEERDKARKRLKECGYPPKEKS